jgi:hypothetical protein
MISEVNGTSALRMGNFSSLSVKWVGLTSGGADDFTVTCNLKRTSKELAQWLLYVPPASTGTRGSVVG